MEIPEFSPYLVLGVIFVILAFLAFWERKTESVENKRAIAQVKEAKYLGTTKALSQYPQINPFLCIGCGTCIQGCPEKDVIGMVDGIARVIHGSRCVGHGVCGRVCPVGAIVVGLGDTSKRPDLPILSDSRETSVPGIYIAGELGGISLIKNALFQGAETVKHIAETLKGKSGGADVYDILIVGAGPAGLSASLKATELKLKFKTIDMEEELGGTVRKFPRRKLTLVQDVQIPLFGTMKGREYLKEEVVEIWEGLYKKHKIDLSMKTKLMGVEKKGDVFEVKTSNGDFKTRTVLLCMGRRGEPRKMGVPGESGEKVLYSCLDAATYNNLHILVVGGGDSAIEIAIGMANQTGNTVTLSYRKHAFFRLKSTNDGRIKEYTANKKINLVMSSEILSVEPKSVKMVVKEEGKPPGQPFDIPNDYVFVLAGSEPAYPFLKKMGIKFGEAPPEEKKEGRKKEGSPADGKKKAA